MPQYKVLRLPSFFEATTQRITLTNKKMSDAELILATSIELAEDCGLFKIPTVFNRDGWYLDRKNKVSWCEWRGTAWTKPRLFQDFKYRLETLDARTLTSAEIDAIKTLRVYHKLPKELSKALWHNQDRLIGTASRRQATLYRNSILRAIKSGQK